jgi:hypothetical protein
MSADWSISLFEVLYLILVVATLCVGIWNLIALRRYVAHTATMAKMAQDQLEAAWTPCVLPDLPVERYQTGNEVEPIRAAPVHLKNAGHGPALDVQCRLETADSRPLGGLATPFLAAGTSTATQSLENPPDRQAFNWGVFHLRATYKSVSGKKYETVATVAPGEAATQYHLIYFGLERENIPLVERYTSAKG